MHRILKGLLAVALALPLAMAACAQEIKVTLLGTGSPNPGADRFSMSTLVEAGGQRLLFDAGRGSTVRLWQAGVPIGSLDAVFLTHFHSDHTVGLPDLMLTGWIDTPYGRRKTPLRLLGPRGTLALARGIEAAFATDIETRIADEGLARDAARFDAVEFQDDGTSVYERGGVKVVAFKVDHGEKIQPAYGYRIEYQGRSVAISGDTRFSPNLVRHAKGVDLLIHEVCTANENALKENKGFQAIVDHHVTPADAGRVFAATQPKLAVYSHLVFLSDTRYPRPTVDDVVQQTRKTYDGPLVVGSDLAVFSVGEQVRQLPDAGAARR